MRAEPALRRTAASSASPPYLRPLAATPLLFFLRARPDVQANPLAMGFGHMRTKFGASVRFSYDGMDVGDGDTPLGLGMCDGEADDAGDGNGAVYRGQIDVRV